MPRRLSVFSASMSCLIESPCRTVCMNCLAWFRLNSSREALASPIWRMPRFLFHSVLERVRCGIATAMSLPLKAEVATLSARSTTLPRVTLSRSRIRLLTRSLVAAAAFGVFFFAMICISICVESSFVGERQFARQHLVVRRPHVPAVRPGQAAEALARPLHVRHLELPVHRRPLLPLDVDHHLRDVLVRTDVRRVLVDHPEAARFLAAEDDGERHGSALRRPLHARRQHEP